MPEFDVNIQLTGAKELDALFRKLPNAMSVKVVRSAARIAARPLIKSARSRIQRKSENLYNSIGAINGKKDRREKAYIIVGPRVGGRNKSSKGYHAHLVEGGTKAGIRKVKKKNSAGFMLLVGGQRLFVQEINHSGTKPQPFMEPAWNSTRNKIAEDMGVSLGIALEKFVDRTIKKAK